MHIAGCYTLGRPKIHTTRQIYIYIYIYTYYYCYPSQITARSDMGSTTYGMSYDLIQIRW